MITENSRSEVSNTLSEIEQAESRLDLCGKTIIDPYFIHDRDAAEALAIVERIERKLFPAGMPY